MATTSRRWRALRSQGMTFMLRWVSPLARSRTLEIARPAIPAACPAQLMRCSPRRSSASFVTLCCRSDRRSHVGGFLLNAVVAGLPVNSVIGDRARAHGSSKSLSQPSLGLTPNLSVGPFDDLSNLVLDGASMAVSRAFWASLS